MFYCTLYNGCTRKTLTGNVTLSLSYDSENSARAYQQFLLGNAMQLGATVEKIEGYYFITGKIAIAFSPGFIKSKYTNYFMVGVETDDTLGAKSIGDFTKDMARDGLEFERRCRKWKELKAQEIQKENETIDKHLADFTAEIENKDLKETLKLLIKYSQYVSGQHRDKLLDIAVDKLQGNTKSSSWYDELSDINN